MAREGSLSGGGGWMISIAVYISQYALVPDSTCFRRTQIWWSNSTKKPSQLNNSTSYISFIFGFVWCWILKAAETCFVNIYNSWCPPDHPGFWRLCVCLRHLKTNCFSRVTTWPYITPAVAAPDSQHLSWPAPAAWQQLHMGGDLKVTPDKMWFACVPWCH